LRHDHLVLSKEAAVRLGTTLGPRVATPVSEIVSIEAAPAKPPKAVKPAKKTKAAPTKKAAAKKKPAAKKDKGKK